MKLNKVLVLAIFLISFLQTSEATIIVKSQSANTLIDNSDINNFNINYNYNTAQIPNAQIGYEQSPFQYRPYFKFNVSNSIINNFLKSNAVNINISTNFNRDISAEYLNSRIDINKEWHYEKEFWCQTSWGKINVTDSILDILDNGSVVNVSYSRLMDNISSNEIPVTATTLLGNTQIVYTLQYNLSNISAVGNTITCYDPINGNGKYEQGKGTASTGSTNLSFAFNNSIISGNTIILGISLNDNTTAINKIGSNLSPGLKWQNATSHILGNAISEQIFYAENITGGFINIEVNSSPAGQQ